MKKQQEQKVKGKPGRPSKFNAEIAATICQRMSEGETARSICRDINLPWGTLCNWTRENKEFSSQYTRAREDLLAHWAEEIIEDAHNESRDVMLDAKGNPRSDNTAVNRDRLKVDTKKWLLSKLLPKVYGDKVTQELTGAEGAPLVPVITVSVKGQS